MAKMTKMVAYKSQNIVKNSPFFSILEYSRQDVFTTFLTPFTRILIKLRTLGTLVYRESSRVENLILLPAYRLSAIETTANKNPCNLFDYRDLAYNLISRLLVECLSYVNCASYGATYHGVVTDAEEAHHLYVSRY